MVTEGVSAFTSVMGGRIRSLLKQKLKTKVEPLINKAFRAIPERINVPNSEIYLEGGLSRNVDIKKDDYVQLPISVRVQSERYPYD